jgi:putative ubiquitin-RnfH superfamily antitoxin RatB of RatAB toxin-antitoxin module
MLDYEVQNTTFIKMTSRKTSYFTEFNKSNSLGKRSTHQVRQTIKYLAQCPDKNIRRLIVKKASSPVIKEICNAALNATRGDVQLSKAQKGIFSKNRKIFQKLTSHKVSIPAKRKVLVQRGGLAILPIILSTVLGSLGSLLFSKSST